MKVLKQLTLLVLLILFLMLTTGCPDFLKAPKTEVEVIVQAPCEKDKLTIEITDVVNNGKSGGFYTVTAKIIVKCDGEGIPASFYSKIGTLPYKIAETDMNGEVEKTLSITGDPAGKIVTVKIYSSESNDDPAHTETKEIPSHQ